VKYTKCNPTYQEKEEWNNQRSHDVCNELTKLKLNGFCSDIYTGKRILFLITSFYKIKKLIVTKLKDSRKL